MSTYILMKILESAPSRYDRGIRILTLGRLDKVYDRLTSHIKSGERVLDIGCGTGALSLRAAQKGAKVKGIDVNSQMLEITQKRAMEANLTQNMELCEMGVAELGSDESESYDAVMSGLCFSELTEDELAYSLKELRRILKPGGLLLIADEVRPKRILKKMVNWLIRFPLVIITYLITQTTTKAVKELPKKIEESGFLIESVTLNRMGNFIELVTKRPEK
ncbi:class I SAM-dependent methyltransferase [candidate division KSB1 bacterium]|nr:class I SAM-dependent methyltransferase [candidate division KSB1 bacterium]